MGQKTHPYGFRLGITKPWLSRWYSRKDYAKYIREDVKIRKMVKEKLFNAGITATFSLIFGLPDETEADRRATLTMLREIKSRFPTTEFHSNIYTPYPGAPNFSRAVSMGLKEPESLEEWAAFYPKFMRLPWHDDATHRRIQRMREYIRIAFPHAPVRRRSGARLLFNQLLAPAARLRLQMDQYGLPVELWALKSMIRLKSAMGLSVRTHVVQS